MFEQNERIWRHSVVQDLKAIRDGSIDRDRIIFIICVLNSFAIFALLILEIK